MTNSSKFMAKYWLVTREMLYIRSVSYHWLIKFKTRYFWFNKTVRGTVFFCGHGICYTAFIKVKATIHSQSSEDETYEQHSPKICINKSWSLANDVKHVWITWLTHLLTLTSNKIIMGVDLGHVILPVWSGISWYRSLGFFCSIWGYISAAVAFIWTKKKNK